MYRRHAPRVLEVGCGNGEVIVSLAAANTGYDYLGIEVYKSGLGQALNEFDRRELNNARMLCADAAEVLTLVPSGSFERICLFFPDPWPKKRHHKRRLIQPAFAAELLRVLPSHGRLFVATDWQDYAVAMLSVLCADAGFFNLAGDGRRSPRPAWRPITRYEQRAHRQGREVYDFAFGKSYLKEASRLPGEGET